MRFEGEEDAQVVEGEVVGRTEPGFRPAARGPIYEVADPYQQAAAGGGVDMTGLVDAGVSLASNPRSRTIALLVKLPLFAYVALNHKMPPLVRLAAAGLGVMEALELAQRQDQVVEMMPSGY